MSKLSFTVTGDIGAFTAGQVLTDEANVATYYRTVANEGADRPTKLTDKDILAIVLSVEGDNEDAEMERVSLIEAGKVPAANVPKANVTMSAARKELEALELGKRADNNDTLTAHLVKVSDAKQWLSSCAYFIMKDFEAQYGRDVLLTFPIIGARSHDENDLPTGHPNPDCYKRPTKRKGGGKGQAMDYWHKHFAAGLKPIREMHDAIAAEKAKEGAAKLGERQLEAFENKYSARIESATGKVKQALELFQQLERAANYPACVISWEKERVFKWEDDGTTPVIDPKTKRQAFTWEVAEVEKPIYVEDADKETKLYYQYSIQQFLSLDFDKANENGGTFEALIDTVKREPRNEDEDGVGIIIADKEDALTAINGLASYLSEKANKIALIAFLMSAKDGNEDAKEALTALDAIAVTANGLVGPHRDWLDEQEETAKKANKVA